MSEATQNTRDDLLKELRTLSHDLSNALEAVVQASYLVNHAEIPDQVRRWAGMLDEAAHDAVRLNRKLRDILRAQSPAAKSGV